MTRRDNVFISYSHKDAKWLERLLIHLRPLEHEQRIQVWNDTRIAAGANWREEIKTALNSARIAVLLISANFLASDFIAKDELPPLLRAAEKDGVLVLPLILSPSRFLKTNLSYFQAVNDPSKPLIKMRTGEQEETLVKLTDIIESSLTHPPNDEPATLYPQEDEIKEIQISDEGYNTTPGEITNLNPVSEDANTFPTELIYCVFCRGRIPEARTYCPHCGSLQFIPNKPESTYARGKLVVADATSTTDASFILENETTLIGRSDPKNNIVADIDLTKFDPEHKVSRRHARISRTRGVFLIEDLGSINGTVINDVLRLGQHQPRALNSGDRLRLGETTIVFIQQS